MTNYSNKIDTDFDYRTDSQNKDPDLYSNLLKQHHKFLWTKPLPNGNLFDLQESKSTTYLQFADERFIHHLTSDSIVNSYGSRRNPPPVIKEIEPSLIESFKTLNSTIGGFILFPGNKLQGASTINQERGINGLVADRFDITLECIRLNYLRKASPLTDVLNRYKEFFALFMDFKGYVDFFLLNDLVDSNYLKVNFFNDFGKLFVDDPIPKTKSEYLEYRTNSMSFTLNRNKRIKQWLENNRI